VSAIASPSAKIQVAPLAVLAQFPTVPVRPKADDEGRYEHGYDEREQSHLDFRFQAGGG
jgi:hypothetical protein